MAVVLVLTKEQLEVMVHQEEEVVALVELNLMVEQLHQVAKEIMEGIHLYNLLLALRVVVVEQEQLEVMLLLTKVEMVELD
jgi:hypothetical protein